MSHGDPRKWDLPGWRIEQRYSQGVLIGNWSEERNTFKKGDQVHNSTHRNDFRNFGNHRPDVIIRRKALLRSDGLGPERLFYHHGNRYSNNMVSWYDELYNGRWRENTLPDLRTWNGHELAWCPEKSDFPIQGEATNFDMYDKCKQRWENQIADETRGDYCTTYQGSFIGHPGDALVNTHRAISRENSTALHPTNKINKDLHLRNVSALKSPERLSLSGIAAVSC